MTSIQTVEVYDDSLRFCSHFFLVNLSRRKIGTHGRLQLKHGPRPPFIVYFQDDKPTQMFKYTQFRLQLKHTHSRASYLNNNINIVMQNSQHFNIQIT